MSLPIWKILFDIFIVLIWSHAHCIDNSLDIFLQTEQRFTDIGINMFRIPHFTDIRLAPKVDAPMAIVAQQQIMETAIVTGGYPVPDISVPVSLVLAPIVPSSRQVYFQPQGTPLVVTHNLEPAHLIFDSEHHLQGSVIHDITIECPVMD